MPIFTSVPDEPRPVNAPDLSDFQTSTGNAAGISFRQGLESNYQNLRSVSANVLDRTGLLGEDRLSVDEANRVGSDYGLTFNRPVTPAYVGVLTQQKQQQQEDDYLLSRAPQGLAASTAIHLAGFGGMAADPSNIALGFVPVVGEARYAALLSRFGSRVAARAVVGGIEGTVGAGLLEPLNAAGSITRDDPYSAEDTLANLTFGGVLGGGLHVAGGEVADAFRGGGIGAQSRARGFRAGVMQQELSRAADDYNPAEGLLRPVPTVSADFKNQQARHDASQNSLTEQDVDMATRALWAEGRGEPLPAQQGIVHTMLNRLADSEANGGKARQYGRSLTEIIEKPSQFSTYSDPNIRRQMMGLDTNSPEYQKLRAVVEQVASGKVADNTGGATHFLGEGGYADWANSQLAEYGKTRFFAPDGRISRNGVDRSLPASTAPRPRGLGEGIESMGYTDRADTLVNAITQTAGDKAVDISAALDAAMPDVEPTTGRVRTETPAEDAAAASGGYDGSLNKTASWVLREKETGKVVMETFDRQKVDALNTDKYEAVPIQNYLGEINGGPKAEPETPRPAPRNPRQSSIDAMAQGRALKEILGFTPKDIKPRIRELGGFDPSGLSFTEKETIKSAGGDHNNYGKEFREIWGRDENFKAYVTRTNGKGPDELALILREEGYLPKDAGPAELRDALARSYSGEKIYPTYKPEYQAALEEHLANEKQRRYEESAYRPDDMQEYEARSPTAQGYADMLPPGDTRDAWQALLRSGHVLGDEAMQDLMNDVHLLTYDHGDMRPIKLPDTWDGDAMLQASDVAAVDRMAERGESTDAEKLLAETMDQVQGLNLTDAEKQTLAEADKMVSRVDRVENAIKAAVGCILRG